MKVALKPLLILLVLLASSVNAQDGGGFNPFKLFTDFIERGVGMLGGFIESVGEFVDTIALSLATTVLGENPQVTACKAIQGALAGQSLVSCTDCVADIDVLTTDASIKGVCSTANSCPAPEICGTCTANYDAVGDLTIPTTFDGKANLVGNCDVTGGSMGSTYDTFSFDAVVGIKGDVAAFSEVDLSVQTCTATLLDVEGNSIDCGCNSEGCGPLEISFSCGDSINATCVSITSFS